MTKPEPEEALQLTKARENLELLQAQVDQLHLTKTALQRRVEHLHQDRDTLRAKVHALETTLYELKNRQSERLRQSAVDRLRRRTPRPTPRPPQPLEPTQPAFRESTVAPNSDLVPEFSFPEIRPKRNLRVAAIMDDFSRAGFSPEFDYVPITPDAWQDQLADPPDMLLVESAFGGNGGTWVNEISGFRPPRHALADLTDWCRKRGIPTVFWNKEDPANFEWFIGAASAFDWVFSVDVNSIPRYRSELGHSRVGSLPFAAQPAIHFPPASDSDRTGNVAFAGSYYAKKHTERRRQMEVILGPALEFGLDIFDRMGSLNDPRFAWPEQYRSHLRGSLSYPQTTEAYRRYKVFLNVNTVTDSPTMCARRVFELLASGTPVISGPAVAIDKMVPAEAIAVSRSAKETRLHLENLLNSPEERERVSEAGRRWIENGNTYSSRVDEILSAVRKS